MSCGEYYKKIFKGAMRAFNLGTWTSPPDKCCGAEGRFPEE